MTKPTPEATLVERPGHELDECECGDYRRDHPNNGPCNFNSHRNNGGISHGNRRCEKFVLSSRAEVCPGCGKLVSACPPCGRDPDYIQPRPKIPCPIRVALKARSL